MATRIQPPQNVRLFRVSKKNVTRVNINNYVEVVYFKVENIEFLTIWFRDFNFEMLFSAMKT